MKPPPPWKRRQVRDPHRPKSQHWWALHNHAKTVPCVGRPKGCPAGVGEPCVASDDLPLQARPAHEARIERAETENPRFLPIPTTEET